MCWEGQTEGAGFCLDEIWSLSRERANTSLHGIRKSATVPLSLRWLCQPRPLCRQALKAKEDAHSYPGDASSRRVITLQVTAPPPQFPCKVGTSPCLEASFLSHCSQLWGVKGSLGDLHFLCWVCRSVAVRATRVPTLSTAFSALFFFSFLFILLKKYGVFSLFLKFIHPSDKCALTLQLLRGPAPPFLVWAFKTDRRHRMRSKKEENRIPPRTTLRLCGFIPSGEENTWWLVIVPGLFHVRPLSKVKTFLTWKPQSSMEAT